MGLTAIAIRSRPAGTGNRNSGGRKGENDIAVGNIIGANIFNLVIVLGLPAVITQERLIHWRTVVTTA
ncbi:hypothetical protein ACLK1T_15985 [Escherichia coli]